MKLKTLHEDASKNVMLMLEKYLLNHTKDLKIRWGPRTGFKIMNQGEEQSALISAENNGDMLVVAWDEGESTDYIETNFHDANSFPEILAFVRRHIREA